MMLPATIQLVHLLENHQHEVCISKTEEHFHEAEIDCSLCHVQAETFTVDFTSNYDVIPQHFYSDISTKQPEKIKVVYHSKKSSRAPPYFIV